MQKKIFGILLALCVLVGVFSMSLSVAAVTATEIGTAADLVDLMNDSTKWAGSYKLTADIDLTGLTQASIGNATTVFSGTFDGDGHTVSGLNTASGLFGVISGATIKNLTVDGTVTASAAGAAGIIGIIENNGTIQNCVNYATVTSTVNIAGGIVGFVDYYESNGVVSIENCINYGGITGNRNIGGIVGRAELGSEGSGVTFNLRGCANYGTVTVTDRSAGILGIYANNCTNSTTYIENNLNAGNVVASGSTTGGISGYFQVYAQTGMTIVVRNCMNSGTVSSAASGAIIGGIIGYGSNKPGAYTVENNYNSGSVANANDVSEGAIAGTLSANATVQNNYALDIGETHGVTFETAVTTANYTDAATFTGFSTDYWMFTEKGPELITHHTHDLDAKYTAVEGGHVPSCYCNDATTIGATEEHTFVDGICTLCGEKDTLHTHDYTAAVTAPTCTAGGYTTYTCTCGESYIADEVAATDHTWNSGVVTVEPTPNADGTKKFTCTVCGETKTEAVEYVCTEHVYIAAADGTYRCAYGCVSLAAPTAPVLIAASPASTVNGKATVSLSVKATSSIMGGSFAVDAPEGFVLTDAEILVDDSTGFTFVCQDASKTPYDIAFFNTASQDATIDAAVLQLTFTVADSVANDTYVVSVENIEVYNYAMEMVEAVGVSAEFAVTGETAEDILGDIDGDGSVTIKDALVLIRAIVNDQTIENGDLNGDGKVSLIDVLCVMKMVAGVA